jgi:hypothetical protein
MVILPKIWTITFAYVRATYDSTLTFAILFVHIVPQGYPVCSDLTPDLVSEQHEQFQLLAPWDARQRRRPQHIQHCLDAQTKHRPRKILGVTLFSSVHQSQKIRSETPHRERQTIQTVPRAPCAVLSRGNTCKGPHKAQCGQSGQNVRV